MTELSDRAARDVARRAARLDRAMRALRAQNVLRRKIDTARRWQQVLYRIERDAVRRLYPDLWVSCWVDVYIHERAMSRDRHANVAQRLTRRERATLLKQRDDFGQWTYEYRAGFITGFREARKRYPQLANYFPGLPTETEAPMPTSLPGCKGRLFAWRAGWRRGTQVGRARARLPE